MPFSFRETFDRALPSPLRQFKASAGRLFRFVSGRFTTVNDRPTFVLGNQKSGTTVIAAALAHAANASVTLDIRDLNASHLAGLLDGTLSIDAFVNRYRGSFSTSFVKEPGLTFAISKLRDRFPEATFILITRDPRDNIRSLLNRLSIPGDASVLTADHLQSLHSIWRSVITGSDLGIDREHYIENLATRWNLAADVYLEHPNEVMLLKYEAFCDAKVAYIEKSIHQLGRNVVQDVTDIVQTQYQSRGNRHIEWEQFFGTENLERIERVCKSRMTRLDYLPL